MAIARPRIFVYPLLVILAGVSGCEFFQDTVEGRARSFLETLVSEPHGDRLKELSLLRGNSDILQAIISDTSTRHAVDYLRARHRQGMRLAFAVIVTQHVDATHRDVLVDASADRPGSRSEDENRIRFLVSLKSSAERGWLVTRLKVE